MGPQYTEALEAEVNRLSEVVKTLEAFVGQQTQALDRAEHDRDAAEQLCHMIAAYDNHEITFNQLREAYSVWRNE